MDQCHMNCHVHLCHGTVAWFFVCDIGMRRDKTGGLKLSKKKGHPNVPLPQFETFVSVVAGRNGFTPDCTHAREK